MVYKIGDFSKTNVSSYSAKEKWDEIHYLDTGNITAGKIADIQRLVPGVDTIPSRAKRKVQVNDRTLKKVTKEYILCDLFYCSISFTYRYLYTTYTIKMQRYIKV